MILRELLDNWPDLERLLVKHGAFYPMIDKVRRIRNDIVFHTGRLTRSERAFRDAMRTIGMAEMGIRSAGAEEEAGGGSHRKSRNHGRERRTLRPNSNRVAPRAKYNPVQRPNSAASRLLT